VGREEVVVRHKDALGVGDGRRIKVRNLDIAGKGRAGNALDDSMKGEDVKAVYSERLLKEVIHVNVKRT
jgi:hypothetical protein